MSVIRNIYNALEDVTVTTTSGVTPTAYDLDELKEGITTADLPCRLLLPLGSSPGEGREGQFIAVGTTMAIVWQVNDLMLWQASEQGRGLQEFAPEIVDYCGKYLDAMRTFRKPYGSSALESVNMNPGEYEWPTGSGRYYAGVLCQLSIREAVNG
jgi:hypothetical protein